MKKVGLYIHIPFCAQKCNYCDFLSFGKTDPSEHEDYIEALLLEIQHYGSGSAYAGGSIFNPADYEVDSIFIGGGTPSLIDAELIYRVMKKLNDYFVIDQDAEISIEVNPGTATVETMRSYRAMGINRVSFGLQSFDPDVLKKLGRIHTADDFLKQFWNARKIGFSNINIDLMFGIPGQTLDSWQQTCLKTMQLMPEHLSFYGLKIEEGTPFHQLKQAGLMDEITDELDRSMYAMMLEILYGAQSQTYHTYEISNAALSGYECRHNLKYWSMEDYLGLGLGAHSYLTGERFSNITELKGYLASPSDPVLWRHLNTPQDDRSEFIFTGMRKIKGISFDAYLSKFGEDLQSVYGRQIDKFEKEGLIKITKQGIQLTLKGIDLSNYVLSEFV